MKPNYYSDENISSIIDVPKPNTEIWIADNICINCHAKYRWWHRLFVRLFLGWKVKRIDKT